MPQRDFVTRENRDKLIASLLGEDSEAESDEEEVEVEDPTKIQCGGPCGQKTPTENIARCEAGHTVCFEDARNYVQAQLGKGVAVLKCMNPACDKIFPGTEVLKFIDLNVFKGLPKERLEIMIERVGVKDLVELCPNCVTVVVCGPHSQTQIINCPNPTCKRQSCRKCTKLAHGSKDCDEAAKDSLECGHCLKVYPASEIVRCEGGHPFCIHLAKEYAQSQLGKGVPVLNCLKPECDMIFPGIEVLRFINLNVFKGLPRATLEIMIDRVGVRGLVEICRNCETVVACVPLEGNNVFLCTNTNCKHTYCRKCQKDPHHSLTCEENDAKLQGKAEDSGTQSGGGTTDPRDAIRILIEMAITVAIERTVVQFEIEQMLNVAIFKRCNNSHSQLLKETGGNTQS